MHLISLAIVVLQIAASGAEPAKPVASKPAALKPTHAGVVFGPHPHQLIDIYLPTQGDGPYPALLWYGGIWKAAKHLANLGFFQPQGIAVMTSGRRALVWRAYR